MKTIRTALNVTIHFVPFVYLPLVAVAGKIIGNCFPVFHISSLWQQ
jgi:hypothetical protein